MLLKDNAGNKIWLDLMKIGAKAGCHQRADRSFFINNRQFPVCARCTGVIIGYIAALTVFAFRLTPLWLCLVLCLIMLADWLIQYLKIKESNNIRRLFTGILGGYGLLSFEINAAVRIIGFFASR